MKKKRIQVKCYEPISIDKTAKQGWSDIIVISKWKRKVYKSILELVSYPCLESDIELEREIDKEFNGESSLKKLIDIRSNLGGNRFHLDYDGWKVKRLITKDSGTIYTKDSDITRQTAEDMIKYFFQRNLLGTNRLLKFVWRRPEIIVCPV